MKIAPKSAEAYLAKPEHRAILLYGPDSGLVRQRAKTLAATMCGKDDVFGRVELTEAKLLADPALLADELSAISMMSPRRAIMITGAGDKLTRIIEGAACAFNDSTLLVVCADELPARSSLRAWFEKESACAAIACYRDEVRDVQEVVRKAFAAAGVSAGREVVEYLSQQLGNDRAVTLQELEKLVTFAGETKTLTLENVRLLVEYNRETGFDEMINAVAGRNLAALDKTLTLLLREGVQPVAYVRALQRYFNRLYYIKGRMAAGAGAEEVIASLRPPVFFRQAPLLTCHAQTWSLEAVVKALGLLVAAELACKTSDLPPVAASHRRLLQVTQAR